VLLPGFTGQKPPCILVGESVLNFSWEITHDSLEINYFVSQEPTQRWPSATEVCSENKAIVELSKDRTPLRAYGVALAQSSSCPQNRIAF